MTFGESLFVFFCAAWVIGCFAQLVVSVFIGALRRA